ncbi:MAG: bifunctional homocysteine S-methyltransferase/methylenetetrahydrofolate reductase [Oscillospiraceae bacterium]|nr:bifunctional homocysteine S-methyltransferase/methylenetetrahydrofolate reductase [Oscillospiraceae bacterium]
MTLKEFLCGRPLIFDGAFGTYYAQKKDYTHEKCEIANIDDIDTVTAIHKEYIAAGCNAIKTNTFCANPVSLGSGELSEKVIKSACRAAKNAVTESDKDIFIFADIGPTLLLQGDDPLKEYRNTADIFLSEGINSFLFETFPDSRFLPETAEYIKSVSPGSFIITSFAVNPEGYTRLGISGKKIISRLSENDNIDAVGFNCVCGAQHILEYIKQLGIVNKTISVMPNSGYPSVSDSRMTFDSNPGYFAEKLYEIAGYGAKILGGCCGTTPEYIKCASDMLAGFKYSDVKKTVCEKQYSKPENSPKNSHVNPFVEKMKQGKKVIAVELDPPVNDDIEFFISAAARLKTGGVDAVTVADCPIARARMDSSLLACKLKRELGLSVIPHMTCRDRNINATKALLLGMSMEGVDNVLAVTGDPVPLAERNEIKPMFSFNSAILARHISTLNETTFKQPFHICGALNVNAVNFGAQLERAHEKIECGVTTFLTQPVLSHAAFENLKLARKELDANILGGIIPVVSYKNACFMNNEISGISICDEIIRLYENADREKAAELAVDISEKTAKAIYPYVNGFYLIMPFKRIEITEEIIKRIGKFHDTNK